MSDINDGPKNHPFLEIVEACEEHIKKGAIIFQKFTCANCGSRQTIDVPNALYMKGICEECNHVTDIVKDGCNYMLIYSNKGPL